jgi:hypothetical protein
MHMDYLWFDLAVRGEPDLLEDAIARLHLSDEAGSAHDEDPVELRRAAEKKLGLERAPAADFF